MEDLDVTMCGKHHSVSRHQGLPPLVRESQTSSLLVLPVCPVYLTPHQKLKWNKTGITRSAFCIQTLDDLVSVQTAGMLWKNKCLIVSITHTQNKCFYSSML